MASALGKMKSNTQLKSPQNKWLLDKLSRIIENLATPFKPETSCDEGLAKIILALSNFSSVDYRNQGEHSAAIIPLPDLASPKQQPEILKKSPRVKFHFAGHGKKAQTFSNAKGRKLDESIARLRKANKELKKKLNEARQELNLGPKDYFANASNEVFESEGEGFFHEPEVSRRDGMQHLLIDNSNIPDPGPTKTSNEKKVFKCDVCPMEFTAKGTLEKHKMKHAHPLKWIECQYCEHKTIHAGNMIRHLRIHGSAGENQQFKCDVCSKNFSRKDNLKFHKLGHMTPQACPFCDKYETPYPIRLTHHIRMTHNK